MDDSALMRHVLEEIIADQPDMQVVGTAPDAYSARALIKETNPDVLTLDVEMPGMDGLTFLERLMRLRPMPVLMVSSLTEGGSEVTLRALELGAVDFVSKPKDVLKATTSDYAELIAEKIRTVARANVARRVVEVQLDASVPAHDLAKPDAESIIAIGASTGGTEAIKEVLLRMPADSPPILIVQHMPPGFTQSFAHRLNLLCKMAVSEAVDGERIESGHAYVAPGHSHLLLVRGLDGFVVRLSQAEPVNRHRPSVDVLFASVAEHAGQHAIGIILTGMGKDGAQGMLAMKQAGAYNFAQNEASSVVFGMPREAIAVGAVDETCDVTEIAARAMSLLRGS